MLTLIQLLKVIKDKESIESLMIWCRLIADDISEADELAETLDNDFGIELSDLQLDRLIQVCQSGKYKSAFELNTLQGE